MASQPLPCTDGQNSSTDVSSRVAVNSFIRSAGAHDTSPQDAHHALLRCLSQSIGLLLPGIQNLDSVCHKDVYSNEPFVKLLKVIAELGRCAQSDLEECQKLQQCESKVLGITGSVIYSGQEQGESCQDVAVNPVQPLPLEDRWEAFHTSVRSCKDQLQKLGNLQLKLLLKKYTAADKLLKSSRFTGGQDEALMHSSLTKHKQMEILVNSLRARIIQEVEGSSWDCLSACCSCLSDVMKKWRSLDAWIYGKIIAASEDQIESVLWDLDSMFHKCLNVLKHLTTLTDEAENAVKVTIRDRIRHLVDKLYSIGCHMKEKPQSCHLDTDKMNVSVRLFGLQIENIEGIYVFPESDYKNRQTTEYLWASNKSDWDIKGGCATVKNIALKEFYRAPKRNSTNWCVQFYRVFIKLRTHFVGMPIVECLSPPFTIRSGSLQLWEREGAIRWYCFTAADLMVSALECSEDVFWFRLCLKPPHTSHSSSPTGLFSNVHRSVPLDSTYPAKQITKTPYSEPCQCQPKMSIPELLTMLQAMITAAVPDKQLDCDEIQALGEMLHTLNEKDHKSATSHESQRVSLRQFVKDHIRKQGKDRTGINGFSCFTWFVASVNTLMYLRQHTHLRGCSEFASFDQVQKKKMPIRSAWVRISRNVIETPTGKLPYADVVVHFNTKSAMESYTVSHTRLEKCPLSTRLSRLTDGDDNRLIGTIQPQGLSVEELEKLEKQEQGKANGYRTAWVTLKKERILPDFANLHVSVPGDESDVDLPFNDSSTQVPAKRRRSQTCSSSTVPEIPCPSECSENLEELQASISDPLPEEQLQLYLKPTPSVLPQSSALPYEQSGHNLTPEFPRIYDFSQEQPQQHPQTLTPVYPSKENIDKLLEDCLGEEMQSTKL